MGRFFPTPSPKWTLVLVATSYAIHGVLTGFSADRFIWDLDIMHFADIEQWKFEGIPLFAAYVISFVLFSVVVIAKCVYWCKCRAGPAPAWIEDRRIWSAALSILLSLLSISTLSYDIERSFYGHYPTAYLWTMLLLNVAVGLINGWLFFFS